MAKNTDHADRPPNPPADTPPDKPAPAVVDLQAAVSSLVLAILTARVALDRETATMARAYQQDEVLSQFPTPAFAMSEVTLRLPYAAVDVHAQRLQDRREAKPDEVPAMTVHVNADHLAQLPPHAVAIVEVRLTQQHLSLLQEEQQPG